MPKSGGTSRESERGDLSSLSTTGQVLKNESLREALASWEHHRWASWQGYFHGKCERQPDGSLVIPAEYVRALGRLMYLAYSELTEEEKGLDRKEADRIIAIVETYLGGQVTEGRGRVESGSDQGQMSPWRGTVPKSTPK